MPEISVGIGQFMFIFEFLSMVGIVVNCALAYFTSERYKEIVVSGSEISWGLDMATFLIIVVSIEHTVLFIKAGISKFLGEDVSDYIESKRTNNLLR